jgi:hypothetical protein
MPMVAMRPLLVTGRYRLQFSAAAASGGVSAARKPVFTDVVPIDLYC